MKHTDDEPIMVGPRSAVVINPGSGAVRGGDEGTACANMARFCIDLEELGVGDVRWLRECREDRGGRFGFIAYRGHHPPPRLCCAVLMPGLALEEVRYVGRGQDAFAFPRLYIDGSSYLWKFAAEFAAHRLDPSLWRHRDDEG